MCASFVMHTLTCKSIANTMQENGHEDAVIKLLEWVLVLSHLVPGIFGELRHSLENYPFAEMCLSRAF